MNKNCFYRVITNNDELWSDGVPSKSDMQLANPEPRQVMTYAGSSSMSPNLTDKILEKYAIVLLFSNHLENNN